MAHTSSTPRRAHAARIVGCGQPPWSTCGGLATARLGDARELRRDDVHDDAAGVDRKATWDVEADTVDRHPPLGDGAALGDPRRRVGAPLVGVHEAGPADGLLERGPHGRVQASRAAAMTSAGTRSLGGATPSNRWAAAYRATAPRPRTSSTMGRTDARAASTSNSARGRVARSSRSVRCRPRRSSRGMTPVAGPGWSVPGGPMGMGQV